MGITGVCDAISKKFGEQITAQKLLPLIIPFSVNESLNFNQVICDMLFQSNIRK
jgi:hypothetical protein